MHRQNVWLIVFVNTLRWLTWLTCSGLCFFFFVLFGAVTVRFVLAISFFLRVANRVGIIVNTLPWPRCGHGRPGVLTSSRILVNAGNKV